MNYKQQLLDPRWQRKRLEIFNRDNFSCQYCYDEKTTLNIHHLSYSGFAWETDNNQLITLCSDCHTFVEYCKKGSIEVVFPYVKRKQKNGAFPVFLMPYTDEDGECMVSVFRDFHNGIFNDYSAFSKSFLECALSLTTTEPIEEKHLLEVSNT